MLLSPVLHQMSAICYSNIAPQVYGSRTNSTMRYGVVRCGVSSDPGLGVWDPQQLKGKRQGRRNGVRDESSIIPRFMVLEQPPASAPAYWSILMIKRSLKISYGSDLKWIFYLTLLMNESSGHPYARDCLVVWLNWT